MQLIDFSRYKRFFAFGCSMTSYRWPTWADMIAREIPESHNYGKSGGGNLFIACSVAEANQRYKFNENDLVMVMWSSVCREDRYFDNWWHTPGNIFTQGVYDEEWVEKFADPKGYLIRDLAMIELTKNLLQNTESEWDFLNMAPFDTLSMAGEKTFGPTKAINDLYKDTLSYVKPDLLTTVYHGRWPETPLACNGQTYDYHPTPKGHYRYLKKIYPRINLSKDTLAFIDEHERYVEQATDCQELEDKWMPQNAFRL